MILVDTDTNASGTLNERSYYIQNWRHDVVAMTDDLGDVVEMTDYTPYGEAIDLLQADFDKDGDVDASDQTTYNAANPTADAGASGSPADFNRDNVVDGKDTNFFDKGVQRRLPRHGGRLALLTRLRPRLRRLRPRQRAVDRPRTQPRLPAGPGEVDEERPGGVRGWGELLRLCARERGSVYRCNGTVH